MKYERVQEEGKHLELKRAVNLIFGALERLEGAVFGPVAPLKGVLPETEEEHIPFVPRNTKPGDPAMNRMTVGTSKNAGRQTPEWSQANNSTSETDKVEIGTVIDTDPNSPFVRLKAERGADFIHRDDIDKKRAEMGLEGAAPVIKMYDENQPNNEQ
jgi:hypothetical protein